MIVDKTLLLFDIQVSDFKNNKEMSSRDFPRASNFETAENEKSKLIPAVWYLRLINFAIDTPLALAVTGLALIATFFTYGYFLKGHVEIGILDFVIPAVGLITFMAYYSVFEYFFAKTPGKFLTRTRAIMEDGSKLSGNAALSRAAVRIVNFEVLSFLGHRNPIGWHDRYPKTLVIKDSR